jgi:hypothetical protein
MKLCPLKHQNKDDSKFCETCGTRILDPIVDSSLDPQPSVTNSTSNLDDNVDIKDVAVVHSDESSVAQPSSTDVLDLDVLDGSIGGIDIADTSDDDGSVDASEPSVDNNDDDDDDDDDDNDNDNDNDNDDNDNDNDDDDDDGSISVLTTSSSATNTPYLTTSAPAVSVAISELKKWADQWEVQSDPYIKGLDEAVAANSDLGMWSSLDPTQLLPEMPNQTTVFHRAGNILAILRNVLVFLPVAITWQAISEATKAYTTWFPAADPTNTQTEKNFLDFWANGYGVLNERFTLPHIGMLDFWIIIFIIAISLLSTALVSRGDSANEKLRLLFEAERLAVAIRIRKALHGKREASPESIATSLADALADLTQTTRDMAEVASRLEASSSGVESLTPQIERLNDHAGVFATQTSTAIAHAVQQLVASVDALNASVSSNVTTVFQSAVTSLQEVGEELKRHATSVEYGTKLLRDDIESIRNGLRR